MNQSAISDKRIELLNLSHPSIKERKGPVIETVLKAIRRADIELKISEKDLYQIIDKAHSNAMEHGNLWNPKKVVNIKVSTVQKYLIIDITDEGNGFIPDEIQSFNENFKKKREGGISIIKQFCDPVWNEKGNSISLRIPITKVCDKA